LVLLVIVVCLFAAVAAVRFTRRRWPQIRPASTGWRSLVFSGQTTMPKSLDGDAAVVEFVAHNAGAIGYISKTTPREGVKVLTVK